MSDFENQDGESHRLSLRDALLDAVEQHRDPSTDEATPTSANSRPHEDRESTAAQRARDEAGRFAKTEAQSATAESKPAGAGVAPVLAPAPANVIAPAAPAGSPQVIAPPSSWKKDYYDAFNKLDPSLQNYIAQREREYNTGVSTYRAEAERARSINGALEPFLPNMQRHNVNPADWINTVGRVHETLLAGSPQQKLQTILGLARDYRVDLSPILSQVAGEGGQQQAQPGAQLNPEVAWMRDQINELSGQLNSFKSAQLQQQQYTEQQQQQQIRNEIEQFRANTEKYPHYEALRETMAGLLQSGIAQDLPSAYEKAFRMNDELWTAQQAAQSNQTEAERKRAAANAATNARAKVVSVKSASPSSVLAATSNAKGRRDQIAEAIASHAGGRV